MTHDDRHALHEMGSEGVVTPEALAMLGATDMAYVKGAAVNGVQVFLVFTADGRELGGFASRDTAFAACRQNELEPVSVH